MFLQINDTERGKLLHLAQDKSALEGLKKIFLKCFLRKDVGDRVNDVNVLAASRLAIEFLEEAFRELENMIEKEKAETQEKNII